MEKHTKLFLTRAPSVCRLRRLSAMRDHQPADLPAET